MQSDFKHYNHLLSIPRERRTNQASYLFYNTYQALVEKGVSPMTRMRGLEFSVFAPLAYDGPLNEKELEFANTMLNQHFSLEEANDIIKQIDLEKAAETIAKFAELLDELHVEYLMDMIVLGLISDSDDDTINEKEDELLDQLQIAVYYK